MYYDIPQYTINLKDFDHVVSIGNKCSTTLMLRDLKMYKESFPFDYIPTTPKLVGKYLKNRLDFVPEQGHITNKDGVWFGHFNTTDKYLETVNTFDRRFDRLIKFLTTGDRILFIYTAEADIYNEMDNAHSDNYTHLISIVNYITNTYGDHCKFLFVHTNKTFASTSVILNCNIHVDAKFISDDGSTHIEEIWTYFRKTLSELLQIVLIK